MDPTPLPIRDDAQSDSGSEGSVSDETTSTLRAYVVRMTPYDKYSFSDVISWMEKREIFFRFVIGREMPKEHFHIVLEVDNSICEDEVRSHFRMFQLLRWKDENGKLPKGYGNKQYNFQACKDIDQAISYACKQKEIHYVNYTKEYIDERIAASFEKKKPLDFKNELIKLNEEFQNSKMDQTEYMVAYCNLKAKYGQQINLNHVRGYYLSNVVKRDNCALEIIYEFLSNL